MHIHLRTVMVLVLPRNFDTSGDKPHLAESGHEQVDRAVTEQLIGPVPNEGGVIRCRMDPEIEASIGCQKVREPSDEEADLLHGDFRTFIATSCRLAAWGV